RAARPGGGERRRSARCRLLGWPPGVRRRLPGDRRSRPPRRDRRGGAAACRGSPACPGCARRRPPSNRRLRPRRPRPLRPRHRRRAERIRLPPAAGQGGGAAGGSAAMSARPAVEALEFESRKVYQSSQRPSYTSWVSFFPGEPGQWYLTCEEVTRPDKPLPQCTRQQWYEMSLPVGYDKSQYRMEIVLLESKDNLKTWKEIS